MTEFLFKSIRRQILIAVFAIFLVIILFVVWLLPTLSERYQQEVMQTMHGHVAQYVVDHYPLVEEGQLNLSGAKEIFHKLMILGPNFEFYVTDTHGNIMAYSAPENVVVKQKLSLAPVFAFLDDQNTSYPILGDDPRHESRKKAFSSAKIVLGDTVKGYLYVVIGSQIYDTIAQQVSGSNQLRWWMWVTLACVLGGLILTSWLTVLATGPLTQLTAAIRKRKNNLLSGAEPDFSPLVQDRLWLNVNTREVTMLTGSFNQLLKKMSEQYLDLKNLHDLRRELVSHISHDLRTPLASLMGYLETWLLHQNKLKSDQSRKFILVAQNNAKKMHNLIEQLFELAMLDSGDVKVQLEAFSIADLAQDVLQKFQLVAQRKQVSLNIFPQETHIQVVGDIEKLERVLSNLVDNALRHTEDGGAITIRLSPSGHLVAIQVEDTGIGIPETDIDNIFKPHYKAENSVRGNTSHGGLGLSITKKLLALHNATIQVKSEKGKGTQFYFALPSS